MNNDLRTINVMSDDPRFIPQRSHSGDAGADLRTTEAFTLKAGERKTIPTGVRVDLPHGTYAHLESRSGLASKNGIITLGGIIDSGYQGEIKAILLNTGDEDVEFAVGDRITQLLISDVHLPEFNTVESFKESDRGENGFGSTQLS